MSYEVWGDGDEDDYGAERLLDAGWWPSEQARDVVDAIKALSAEPVYEGSDKANGISVKFLMRITILEFAAELRGKDDPLVREAMAALLPRRLG